MIVIESCDNIKQYDNKKYEKLHGKLILYLHK